MGNIQEARRLAQVAVDMIKAKVDMQNVPLSKTAFLDGSGNTIGTYKVKEKDLAAVKVLTTAYKGMVEGSLSFSDSIEEAEKKGDLLSVSKLRDLEEFSQTFKNISGLDVIHLKDDQFDTPTLQQLGWSFNSGVMYNDPNWYTSGKPEHAYLKMLSPYLATVLQPTTLFIRTNFYSFSGSYTRHNWQQGPLDQANFNQQESFSNFGVTSYAIKYLPRNKWVTMQKDAHGIPDFIAPNIPYYEGLAKDDHLAYGDEEAGIFGLENVPADEIDFTSLTSIPGVGDGQYEATALINLWKSIILNKVTNYANFDNIVRKIFIPKNMYLYFQALNRNYQALSGNTSNLGSIGNNNMFLTELADTINQIQGSPVEIVKGPVELRAIYMVSTTSIQNYPAFQIYMSPSVDGVTNTFETAPAMYVLEKMWIMSDFILRDSMNLTRIRLPAIANFNVVRSEFVLSGASDATVTVQSAANSSSYSAAEVARKEVVVEQSKAKASSDSAAEVARKEVVVEQSKAKASSEESANE